MGYADYLRGLLAPLGVYRLDGGFSGGELEALGTALDALAEELQNTVAQALVVTATDEGLEAREALFAHPPAAADLAARRAAVAALLRMAGPCPVAAAHAAIGGGGIAAAVAEDGPNAVAVSFPQTAACRSTSPFCKSASRRFCPRTRWFGMSSATSRGRCSRAF
jgi:hypothetical protein